MNRSGCFLPFIFGVIGSFIGGFGGAILGILSGWGIAQLISKNSHSKVHEMDISVLESITKLSLILMKADNTIMRSELNLFRDFMLQNFGSENTSRAIDVLQRFKDTPLTVESAAGNIHHKLNYTERMQILQFLVQLAAADGQINASEWTILARIAQQIQIQQGDFMQLRVTYEFFYTRQHAYNGGSYHSGGQNSSYTARQTSPSESDYAILGVKSSDSNETIKAAYRRLAVTNHPDKVQHLGETARKEAE
ncbi:MAG: TerB family tellurite resistance protein, partial [Bacteroidales bacterium]|nr:TerB family tellurite resistance protein [Bacteroidales bacterium]